VRVSYCDDYVIPLPPRHSFPMPKFRILRDLLVSGGVVDASEVVAPDEVSWPELEAVHTEGYLRALAWGTLGRDAERRMGLPWSPALVRRSRVAVRGTMNAMDFALEDGLGGNLAGGTHHAFADRGEGFCVLNDVAVGLRRLLAAGRIRRALVVDLDVHQGNGTAAIFEGDDRVFTMSMHGAKNFPLRKERSDLDVPLADGLGDDAYLEELDRHWPAVIGRARPDLVVYVQGVDVLAGDKFGRLELTRAGMRERDGRVITACRERGLPLCLLLGGGYSPTPAETAANHAVMFEEARGHEGTKARSGTGDGAMVGERRSKPPA
jgi:acetoin utilization deacetylase AcuC-like enzyme